MMEPEEHFELPQKPLQLIVRLILFGVPPAMGLLALWVGQDASWDLHNYHFYNPYAFLHDRLGYDIAVSHAATYYNPLLHLPFYYAVTNLPPKWVGFVLGCLQGCNIFLVYAIARSLIPADPADTRLPRNRPAAGPWLWLLLALVGVLGAGNLSEIGTSMGDNVLSLLVLSALWVVVGQRRRLGAAGSRGVLVALLAGLPAGAAFGLKLPFAVYAVGLCVACLSLDATWARRLAIAFVFGLGVLAGAAATAGFWMAKMWTLYRNPFFPYFNQFFQSPWGAAGSYRDDRFIPDSLWEWLFFPIRFTLNSVQVGEVPFRDLRFAILYVLLGVLLVKVAAAWIRGRQTAPFAPRGRNAARSADPAAVAPACPHLGMPCTFMIVSFAAWMTLFAVYRYIIVLEMLAPLMIFLLVCRLVPPRRQLHLALALFGAILITLSPADWGRRPWPADFFGVPEDVTASVPANSLVLAAGLDPIGYMIPYFRPEVRFMRIQGYLSSVSSSRLNETDRTMRMIVNGWSGPMYMMYRVNETPSALEALADYGLEIDRDGCRKVMPYAEPDQNTPFKLCAVKKLNAAASN